ncbi:hypothetical protein SDC9_109667 [bioreactor metagenome]|uniref:Uncharacterized protein n=1 Tax=bioreactor metagenome TaxID=1076179 RepID=A0A645BBD7_9ZZZZ
MQSACNGQYSCNEVFHVQGTPSVEVIVMNFAPERGIGPRCTVKSDGVEVAEKSQGSLASRSEGDIEV